MVDDTHPARALLATLSPGRAFAAGLAAGTAIVASLLPLVTYEHSMWPAAFFLAVIIGLGVLQLAPWIAPGVAIASGAVIAGLIPTLADIETVGPRFHWPVFALLASAGFIAELAGRAAIHLERSLALGSIERPEADRRKPGYGIGESDPRSALSRELGRARRYHFKLAFALIEIEAWQSLVAQRGRTIMLDQLGHVTRQIRAHIRSNDEFAYFGSGRCGLILPQTDLGGAHAVLLRVQQILLTETGFTTRVGIAEFPDDAKSEESLVTEAEAALEVAAITPGGHTLPGDRA